MLKVNRCSLLTFALLSALVITSGCKKTSGSAKNGGTTTASGTGAGSAGTGTAASGTGGSGAGSDAGNNSSLVAVPVLNNGSITIDQVTQALTTANLSLGNITSRMENDKPSGTVVDQNPAGGISVSPGTPVDVVIASNQTVTVPAVVGQTQAQAEQMIRDAKLTLGSETSVAVQNAQPVGSITESNPQPGTQVGAGSAVSLKVKQDSVSVPSVISMDDQAAQLRTFNSGLTPVVTLAWRPTDSVNNGKVISQTVAANTVVPRHSNLGFVVSTVRRPIFWGPRQVTAIGSFQILKGQQAHTFEGIAAAGHH